MAAFSLTTLRARVREKADMPITGFITDTATSLDAFINEGIELLHDKLVEAYAGDYMEKSSAFTFSSNPVSLPTDFYKMLGVEINQSGAILTLDAYNRRERNTYRNAGTYGFYGSLPVYKLTSVSGSAGVAAMTLLPVPATGTTGTIYYSPTATTLVASGDTVNFPNGWEKYVVLYATIQCLMKEETDTSVHERQLLMLDEKLKSIVENRDASQPQHSTDIDNVNRIRYWW